MSELTKQETMQQSNQISPAGAVLLKASDRIQYSSAETQELLNRLDRELIHDVWQLHYLDSYQWERLGAPMGFVTAVRRCLEEQRNRKKNAGTLNLTSRRDRPKSNRPLTSGESKQIPEVIITPVNHTRNASMITMPSGLQNGLPLPLYTGDDDGVRAQESSMMKTPKKNNATRLKNRKRTSNSSSSTVSPQQHEESIDTFFPPPMPERQKSQPNIPDENIDDSCFTSEDHWTACPTSSSIKDSFSKISISTLNALHPIS